MTTYILQSGKFYTGTFKEGDEVILKAGDSYELSPEQAEAFKDKFKPSEVLAAEAMVEEAVAKAAEAAKAKGVKA